MTELARLEAQLARREARLAAYLRLRFWLLGLPLGLVGLGLFGLAAAFALVGAGLVESPLLVDWAGGSLEGFNAVLAPFLAGAAGLICARAAWGWWTQRRPSAADPACPIC